MKKYLRLAAVLLLAFCLLPAVPARADGFVGMSSPDEVQRGQSFMVDVVATGAEYGVSAVQLRLNYDADLFTFVKANSVLLETPGIEIADTNELKSRTLKDSGGLLQILAFGESYAPADGVVAHLEFLCAADAAIGPGTFSFGPDSFVELCGGGVVQATTDSLTLQVVDPNLDQQMQEEPYPPQEVQEDPEEIMVYDPADEIQPDADLSELEDPESYGVDQLNAAEETTAETTKAMPTTPPTREVTVPRETESPLRTATGEVLTVPEKGLGPQDIPQGYQGGSETILGVQVPVARSLEKQQVLCWLESNGRPAFYTYDAACERFTLYEREKESQTETATAKREQKDFRGQNGGMGQVILLGGLALASLAVFIYTLRQNLS